MARSPHLDRRDFVRVVVAAAGTIMGSVVGLPVIGYLISPATKTQSSDAWIPAGALESYEIGKPRLFSFTRTKINGWEKTVNSFGVYVLRTGPEEVQVYSNRCTHLSCRVTWDEAGQDYVCPCHDGHFDIQGQVISGPPPKPLDLYETKLEEGNLFIHFKEG